MEWWCEVVVLKKRLTKHRVDGDGQGEEVWLEWLGKEGLG
jgi:hypothetical protein